MAKEISISEARKKLNKLLKDVKQDPDTVYKLTINDVVMGELRSPEADRQDVLPGRSLTESLDDMPDPTSKDADSKSVAREHDRFLYGSS
ncbi:MAG: hypothetical protein ABEJ65_11585 [bacterium]